MAVANYKCDVTAALNRVTGPLVEVGGPTVAGFKVIDAERLRKTVYVTNLMDGLPQWCPEQNVGDGGLGHRPYRGPATSTMKRWGMPEAPDWLVGHVDFQADATSLPIADAVLGGLLTSRLNKTARPQMLREAFRVLEVGGVLVFDGANAEDVHGAERVGFRPLCVRGRTTVFEKKP